MQMLLSLLLKEKEKIFDLRPTIPNISHCGQNEDKAIHCILMRHAQLTFLSLSRLTYTFEYFSQLHAAMSHLLVYVSH
jgi:hypothetical protein